MNILHALQGRLAGALTGLVDDPAPYAAMLKPAQDARHGDYQANCAMALSRPLGRPPRDVAALIIERMKWDDLLVRPEVAGPGFINLRLRDDWLAAQLQRLGGDERLGVEPAAAPRTYVIDYSSPNVAKPLHVGHLRSTIIGDALARLLRFPGHKVITDNHLGDWGTQFGILLYGYKHLRDEEAYRADPVAELARVYVEVRKLTDEEGEGEDEAVKEAYRQETALLHAGDPENVALWQQFMPHCLAEINHIYCRLGVLPFDHVHGESFYNPMLPGVVEDLVSRGLATESGGALVVPNAKGLIPTEEQRDTEEPPAIIRKKDGAFTYTTSDLATIKYRMEHFHPDAILYVVGAPQGLHFKALFANARRWGYDKVELAHITFGSVLGKPERPGDKPKLISTRKGGGALLDELLDMAIAGAEEVYERSCRERRERGQEVPELSGRELAEVHEAVGIGAVKYADLSQNRTSDYIFDVEKMTSTDGNTATYMQYAYARTCGIVRKGGIDVAQIRRQPPLPSLATPRERALGMILLRFPEALAAAAADYRPNLITAYLWDLAKAFSGFFENCPVLKAETPELRQGRLLLCDLTARTIQRGLDLLGIRTIERM
jgi:arginyl-tRNA synthetase